MPDTDENDIPEYSGLKGMISQLAQHQRQSANRLEQALNDIKGSVQRLSEKVGGVSEEISKHSERWSRHDKDWSRLTDQELPALHARMANIEGKLIEAAANVQHEKDLAARELDALRVEVRQAAAHAAKGAVAHDTIKSWKDKLAVPAALAGILGAAAASVLTWWVVAKLSALDAKLAAQHVEPPAIELRGGK